MFEHTMVFVQVNNNINTSNKLSDILSLACDVTNACVQFYKTISMVQPKAYPI